MTTAMMMMINNILDVIYYYAHRQNFEAILSFSQCSIIRYYFRLQYTV